MNPSVTRLNVLACASSLALMLAGCGGGGGSDSAPSPAAAAPAPSPSPASPAPSPAPSPSGSRATCSLSNFEADAIARINAHRAAGATCGTEVKPAAPALAWSAPLTQASLVHSDDMMALNFFSHTGSDNGTVGSRATAAGYIWSTVGENIAAGQPDMANVVAAWMNSPGHCVNIMNNRFRDIGLACVSGTANNTYRTYWTMTLGATR